MNEKIMKLYKIYVKDCWIWAEGTAIDLGVSDNKVVLSIFNKICKPYHYWQKDKSL